MATGASNNAVPGEVKAEPGKVKAVTGTTAIDDNGDLTLAIGSNNEKATFLVCSRSLSRSSHVFKAMLYGSFRESRSTNAGAGPSRWVVELPDDNPVPAAILLNISHARLKAIPPKVDSLTMFYEILVFADKYDMTGLLGPWTQTWVSSIFPRDAALCFLLPKFASLSEV